MENNYYANMKIDLEEDIFEVDVNVEYYLLESEDTLNFYIHKDLAINGVSCNKEINYEVGNNAVSWCPYIPNSKLIKITFNEATNASDCINFNFKYNCNTNFITSNDVNRITKDWVELGLYAPWFPLSEKMEPASFNVKININHGYEVINARKIENSYVLNQSVPFVDLTIIASNSFKCLKGCYESINLNVYYTEDNNEDIAQKIIDYSLSILSEYKKFGSVNGENLTFVLAPREGGGGYCRNGLIVLSSNDFIKDELELFWFVAHELAHIWWSKAEANTWEDWLNESFAEMSALMAIRDTISTEAFNKKINHYKEVTVNSPAIRNLSRSHEEAYNALYMKGPILLNNLLNTIGEDKFIELLKLLNLRHVNTTEKFLNTLEELVNRDVRIDFENSLNK